MPNNNGSHNFLHTIASAPGLYKYGGVALLAVIVAGWLSSGGGAANTKRPEVPPEGFGALLKADLAPVHAPPPVASAQPPAAVQAGPLTLPPQTPHSVPVVGRAQISMAGAPLPPYGVQPAFQSLGRAQVKEHVASFAVSAPKPLKSVAPSSGLLRLRWRAWYRVTGATGATTFVASIGGGDLKSIAMDVDGQQAPVLQGAREVCNAFNGCPPTASTVAGAEMLAPGWHEIEVSAVAAATSLPRPTVTLYVRAPGADAPAALVPSWPAPSKPAPARSAP